MGDTVCPAYVRHDTFYRGGGIRSFSYSAGIHFSYSGPRVACSRSSVASQCCGALYAPVSKIAEDISPITRMDSVKDGVASSFSKIEMRRDGVRYTKLTALQK